MHNSFLCRKNRLMEITDLRRKLTTLRGKLKTPQKTANSNVKRRINEFSL